MRYLLDRRHPLEPFLKYRKWIVLGLSLFVCLFFVIFQPFYFPFYSINQKIGVAIAYLLISAAVLSLNAWGLPKWFPSWFAKREWKVWKEILWIGWNLFSVALGIFLFKIGFGFYELSLIRLFYGVLAALAVGSIPILLYELMLINLAKNQVSPAEHEILAPPVFFQSENEQTNVQFQPEHILYIGSRQNYLEIVHDQSGEESPFLLRNRLYYAEEILAESTDFVRCHRAFIANLKRVQKADLNAHGGKLYFADHEHSVPVSRKYVSQIRELLERV